ncbi:hypothetical protein DPMN_170401 [Dreissena polymorpha]|uniref:Guanine nucleotide exchange factor MSS4 n=1 Tax=Dreissena polymorpha TaxID=45954 RepID=A0A9D4DXS5_DREPO|nr:hypothetical protein DPMN_170401 [Dreissena polymorpha]
MSECSDQKASVSDCTDDDNSNKRKIVCERCSSVVLLSHQAKYHKTEMFLPHMKKKSEASNPSDGETLQDFWLVDDMFTFENVGFSNTVDNIKFLICADCEIGPIGYHDTRNNKEYLIAHDRVSYTG